MTISLQHRESSLARGLGHQFRLAATRRRHYAYALAAIVIVTASEIAVPKLIGVAIDHGIEVSDTRTAVLWAGAILGGAVLASLANAFWFYEDAAAIRIEQDLRRACVEKLHRMHVGFHDHYGVGELIARTSTDCKQAASLLQAPTGPLLALPTILAISTVLFLTNARLALVALAAVPALFFLARRSATVLHPESRRLQRQIGMLTSVVEDTLLGMRVVKGLGAEDAQLVRLRAAAAGVYEQSVTLAKRRAAYEPAWTLIPAIGTGLALWYGGRLVARGEMTLGDLVAFSAYLALLIRPMNWLGNALPRLLRSIAGHERVEEILRAEPEVVAPARPAPLTTVRGELVLDDVRFRYRSEDRDVLTAIALSVPAGSSLALVGPTGAGKSTLLQLVARFYDPTAGRIALDGIDLRDVSMLDLRRALGLVFQETVLFDASIRENLALGDPFATYDQVEAAARLAGAHEFIAELPDSYDTTVGERGLSLSGGQRQRIGLGRALLKSPQLLLLDDPTSALDAVTEAGLAPALREAMRGRTTILVTSRPGLIRLADRAVLLEEGRIAADGPPADLLRSNARYREVVALLDECA